MLRAYMADEAGLHKVDVAGEAAVPPEAVWLDLFEPTPAEERAAEERTTEDRTTKDRTALSPANGQPSREDA